MKTTPIIPKVVGKVLSPIKFPNKRIADVMANIIPVKNMNLLLFGVFIQNGFSVFLFIIIRVTIITAKMIMVTKI